MSVGAHGAGEPAARPAGTALATQSRPFDAAPVTVAWEITRSCPLSCRHCRAEAQSRRDPYELTTTEGHNLIGQAVAAGARVFVVTGGDPLARHDVFDFLATAAESGMHVGFSPSVTPRLTPSAMARAIEVGAGTIHLSLDGAGPATHDAFRGVNGSFERTLRAIDTAAGLGARLQVGTTVSRRTIGDLPRVAELLVGRVDVWSLFFLVPTGRATAADIVSPEEHERVLVWLATAELPYATRAVAAPTYRRVLAQMGRPVTSGVNDGNGFCFVSHRGEVCPSGFLQLPVGNVRQRPLTHWYREAPLFRALRDPSRLGGKCGRCSFRELCGGSRARAWALTGDPLGPDPTCVYEPARAACH